MCVKEVWLPLKKKGKCDCKYIFLVFKQNHKSKISKFLGFFLYVL